jgi:hypothetical protein
MKRLLILAAALAFGTPLHAEESEAATAERREFERAIAEQNAAAWVANRHQRRAEAAELAAREQAERAKLARRPGARIGMTSRQVLEGTNWGKPERVNRTLTKLGVSEQWVYDGGYLYFDNGRLTAIQN